MADLGKKHNCFQCGAKFYDFGKADPSCPKCGAKMKDAPAKPKAPKKEKVAHVIEDDFQAEPEAEGIEGEAFTEAIPLERGRGEGPDPGDLRMDDYDE
ncbi:MAG: FYDLN acid domain-containing protein [Acidobacteria bacterium]|nr:FYDLN acid domain-containing protein [Acidobacteriota bacterium]